MATMKIKASAETVEIESHSLSTDIEQFVWTLSASIATKAQLQKLIPPANLGQNYIEVEFTLGNDVFEMIVEETDCDDTDFSYTVVGKSKAIILAEPYADHLSKVWLNTTAQAICTELCAAAGIVLDWQLLDWGIPYYKVEKRYPIDIISELVKDIGAKLQSLPNGTLVALPYPASSPGDLAALAADYQIDTARNVFERGEKFINRLNFDAVFVTKDASLLDAPTVSVEEISDGDDRILNVYPNPYVSAGTLNLRHASGSKAALTYVGEITERQVEDVLVDAGEARLSKAVASVVNVKWQQDEVGSLTIAENGKITCDKGDMGLATVTYETTYLQYRLRRLSNIAKTLVMSDDLQPPDLTTGSNPAPPVVVKTLSTPESLDARADAELWSQYDSREYGLNVAHEGAVILCGKVARVNIVREQLGVNGWVRAVAIDSTGDEITQSVTVEMPCF